MAGKNTEDYLNEGIYGKRLPKQNERNTFLGTLRERIVIALTKGQVMSDKGLNVLEEAMKENRDAKLLFNGHIAYKFINEEKALANKYNVPYTIITNEDSKTDIGAVLTYDHAIDKENIFMEEEVVKDTIEETSSLFSKVKKWFQLNG
ncbi:YueI family protein [Virgibacillus ndiopensis]|uniref:YueI family protein n=1 Tax=Virgibacillus ndiopensis TaxID=2004408 RepID=UPI000C089BE9|nr:YueI family protein [Virgibacillus ndiopensis]